MIRTFGRQQETLAGRVPPVDGACGRALPATSRSITRSLGLEGVGLHSGRPVRVCFHPAQAGSGVHFVRTDPGVADDARVIAVAGAVRAGRADGSRNCSAVSNAAGLRVCTIEHLMFALTVLSIDSIVVEVDQEELPILDGSALSLIHTLRACGPCSLPGPPRPVIRVRRPVEVSSPCGGARARLEPAAGMRAALDITMRINFPNPHIGAQALSISLPGGDPLTDIAPARTFCQEDHLAALRSRGLIRGGTLDNALVFGHHGVLNEGGLRFADECVRHKCLDAIGDLALAGAFIHARAGFSCSGHDLNIALVRKLMADPANYTLALPDGAPTDPAPDARETD